jgi:hypothetical protein
MLVLLLFFHLICVDTVSIPLINGSILIPYSPVGIEYLYNRTCQQCLCYSQLNHTAMNCFGNQTCQLFVTMPLDYRIVPMTNARLYFPRQQLPNVSRCCMPDLNLLLSRLQSAAWSSTPASVPRCITKGDLNSVGAVLTTNFFHRLDASNISIKQIRQYSASATLRSVAYSKGSYFIAELNGLIVIANSSTLNFTNSFLLRAGTDPRDIGFINDGQTMIVTSNTEKKLLFYNRTSASPISYQYTHELDITLSQPHGVHVKNDTFFYVIGWSPCRIHSYSRNQTGWTERLFVDPTITVWVGGGAHIFQDDGNRLWVARDTGTLQIFNEQAQLIGNITFTGVNILDLIVDENYVLFISDSWQQQIHRVDPQITCSR